MDEYKNKSYEEFSNKSIDVQTPGENASGGSGANHEAGQMKIHSCCIVLNLSNLSLNLSNLSLNLFNLSN